MQTLESLAPLVVWLLQASLAASLVAALVLAAQWLLRRRLPARWRYVLWSLVVLRLVVPVWPDSSWSAFNLVRWERGERAEVVVVAPPVERQAAARPIVGSNEGTEPFRAGNLIGEMQPVVETQAISGGKAETIAPPASFHRRWTWPMALSAAWLAGATAVALASLIAWLRLARKLRRCTPVHDPAVLRILNDCRTRLGVRQHAPLLRNGDNTFGAAALVGLIRPRIILPATLLDQSHGENAGTLRFILLHELAHHQRRDILVNWLLTALTVLYWFNPLLWLTFARIRADRELACDAAVLRAVEPHEHSDYGHTLLDLASLFQSYRTTGLGLFDSPTGIGRRVRFIAGGKLRLTGPTRLLFAILVTAIAVVGLTDGRTKAEPPTVVAEAPLQQDQPAEELPPTVPAFTPGQAIVFDVNCNWWPGDYPPETRTNYKFLDRSSGHLRFQIPEPNKGEMWQAINTRLIDPQRYPIMVFTYRARNLKPYSSYAMWLDDGKGPMVGGICPIMSDQLIADGRIHEFRRDLRDLQPFDLVGSMRLALFANEQGDGELEVLGIRFETAPGAAADEPRESPRPLTIEVVDRHGAAVEGATVTVDADWVNWARSVKTGRHGRAMITPWSHPREQHLITVSHPDMATVRLTPQSKELQAERIKVVLSAAAAFGGVVRNEAGDPIADAAVFVATTTENQRRNGVPLLSIFNLRSDAEGRWRTEPMPADTSELRVMVTHPSYTAPTSDWIKPPMSSLAEQAWELVMRGGVRVAGVVVEPDGRPVVGAIVESGPTKGVWLSKRTVTDAQGCFVFEHASGGDQSILVQGQGSYAPAHYPLRAREGMGELNIPLEKARTLRVRLVDQQGNPVLGASVVSAGWRGLFWSGSSLLWEGRSNADGRFTWENAPGDAVRFRIEQTGYDVAWHNLTAGDDEQTITLRRLGDLPLDVKLTREGRRELPGAVPPEVRQHLREHVIARVDLHDATFQGTRAFLVEQAQRATRRGPGWSLVYLPGEPMSSARITINDADLSWFDLLDRVCEQADAHWRLYVEEGRIIVRVSEDRSRLPAAAHVGPWYDE